MFVNRSALIASSLSSISRRGRFIVHPVHRAHRRLIGLDTFLTLAQYNFFIRPSTLHTLDQPIRRIVGTTLAVVLVPLRSSWFLCGHPGSLLGKNRTTVASHSLLQTGHFSPTEGYAYIKNYSPSKKGENDMSGMISRRSLLFLLLKKTSGLRQSFFYL